MADHVDGLLASVQRFIAEQGGELVEVEGLSAGLRRRAGAAAAAPAPVAPAVEKAREWIRPDAAGVKYSEVWIAQTATGVVVLAHVSSHRRWRLDRYARRWYGVDILTGREVRIAKVLDGSRR